jgi:threonine 3-dehydrogenase
VIATDLEPRADGVQALDVARREQVFDLVGAVRPEAVFHLAAILSARGEQAPDRTYEVNQTGTYNLLEACRVFGVRQLMFTSSIAVYGPGVPDPTPDDVALHPTTMYGVTKVGGELLGAYYQRRWGIDFRGVRFPGLISASLPGGGTSDYALFMYVDGVRKGAYEAFCGPDTRIPLMYMPDAIRGLIELAGADLGRLTRCVYNLAAFSPTAREIADSVTAAIGACDITYAPDPARQAVLDSWPRALDDAAARRDWGWRPAFDLPAMTADLVPRIRRLLAERADALDHDHR